MFQYLWTNSKARSDEVIVEVAVRDMVLFLPKQVLIIFWFAHSSIHRWCVVCELLPTNPQADEVWASLPFRSWCPASSAHSVCPRLGRVNGRDNPCGYLWIWIPVSWKLPKLWKKYCLLSRPRNTTGQYRPEKLERQARVNRPEVSAILSRGCSNFNDSHFLTVIYKLSHPPLFQEALVLIFESIHCVRLGSRNPATLSIDDMKILVVGHRHSHSNDPWINETWSNNLWTNMIWLGGYCWWCCNFPFCRWMVSIMQPSFATWSLSRLSCCTSLPSNTWPFNLPSSWWASRRKRLRKEKSYILHGSQATQTANSWNWRTAPGYKLWLGCDSDDVGCYAMPI